MSFTELFTDPAYLMYGITLVLFIPFLLFSVIASIRVNTVFNRYNGMRCSSGISAEGYVRKMLEANGVYNIRFAAVRGSLTDNFNPTNNTISLSDSVRGASAIGAIGVACHEAGHAVQHAKKYFFSSARIKLVPVVNFASSLMWPIFIIGYILGFASPYTSIGRILLICGLVVMGLTLLFSLVTLPTEFDASRRAYKYLKTCMTKDEARGVKKVLNAAAMTYVASFMITALQFLRILALLLMGRNRNNN